MRRGENLFELFMGEGSWYHVCMDSKDTKRVVPVGVLAALLMGVLLLVEGALMSGMLENRSLGLAQFVPGFVDWVEKEGALKVHVQEPASVSPPMKPQIEPVQPESMEPSIMEPEPVVEVDPSLPVG